MSRVDRDSLPRGVKRSTRAAIAGLSVLAAFHVRQQPPGLSALEFPKSEGGDL